MLFQVEPFAIPSGTNPSKHLPVQRQHRNVRGFFKCLCAEFELVNAFLGSFKQHTTNLKLDMCYMLIE